MQRGRDEQLSDLLDIIGRLERGEEITLAWVMDHFGVEYAAASEWMRIIKSARPRLRELRRGRKKAWLLSQEDRQDDHRALHRALALDLALRRLSDLGDSVLGTELKGAARQARAALSEVALNQFDRLQPKLRIRDELRSRNSAVDGLQDQLLNAIQARKRVRFRYTRLDQVTKEYVVDPDSMVYHRDGVALYGRKLDPGEGDRLYNLDRIAGLEATMASITRQVEEPDPWATSFGIYTRDPTRPVEDISLRVSGPQGARLNGRQVHSSQTIEPLGENGVRVRLRLALCPELVAFVLSLLPHVEIEGPDALRIDVEEAVAAWGRRDPSR